jgi:hypothetical protein
MANAAVATPTCLGAAACEERSMVEVLACLTKYGQRLDIEIAKETGVPLEEVRTRLVALAATGAVIMCGLTRFEQGKRLDAWLCRVSGYLPPRAPGRKPTGKA